VCAPTAAPRRKLVFPGNHVPLTHLPPSSVAIGKTDQADHQYDLSRFWAAVDASNMPAVSFLKAPGYQDGHGGYSDAPGCASARD
jgi:Phosphoesterase family